MNPTFEAKATLDQGHHVKWELCRTDVNPHQCGTTKGNYPAVDLPVNSGHATLKFTINDQTGLNIKFADTNPVWVAKGAQPTGPGLDPQIDGQPTGNGNNVLTFVDKNSLPSKTDPSPVVLKYQLNFKGDTTIPSIDPDIKNGGTNLMNAISPATILIDAAVVSALVSVVVSAIVAAIVARSSVRNAAVKSDVRSGGV